MFTGFLPKLFVGKNWELVIIHNNKHKLRYRLWRQKGQTRDIETGTTMKATRQATATKTFKQRSGDRTKEERESNIPGESEAHRSFEILFLFRFYICRFPSSPPSPSLISSTPSLQVLFIKGQASHGHHPAVAYQVAVICFASRSLYLKGFTTFADSSNTGK